ncbi:uncharacterized protein FOMMEDRAFT_161744 [Fomitiporia mediterranea MF3/22]|uniref:uncharacterized protein n=1 Tax=Fomitiporia mediterranea (strain MF3/22) TaxID=694068 RepID=UPI0004407629|nr:uncharacterized protein FOMMEDRAFT_161744 [Fomitiporia mediterranea MF3/22]EJC98377.1 hypothetical protein FOMMEDRAFT_161744 [Fomitiporia mediterranea MF3/22]
MHLRGPQPSMHVASLPRFLAVSSEMFYDYNHYRGYATCCAPIDKSTGELWKSWKTMRDEWISEPFHLGVFHSDYLLHAPEDLDEPLSLKHVEFNAISSSFGVLSDRASATVYFNVSPYLQAENFPWNNATSVVAEGLDAAHKLYGVKEAFVLFVVQYGERNVVDQP